MIRIRDIDHVVFRVRDLPRALEFYTAVLGCNVERRQDELGLVQLRAGRSLIDLVTVDGQIGRQGGDPPGAQGHNVDHVCLRVEPFDGPAILAFLEASGARPGEIVSRYGAQGEGPSVYLHDPEGNMLELKGPPMERSVSG